MQRLCLLCSRHLFPDITQNAKEYHIPLFNKNTQWGMLDTTKYLNDGSKKGLNCDPHYDPGLLSIHYRSTQPGLQLKNEHGRWIIPPDDKSIAIIWTGHVAIKINPSLKPGVHRVVNSETKKPRIALWYEICTEGQLHDELKNVPTKKLAKKEHETGIPISKLMPPSEMGFLRSDIKNNKNETNKTNTGRIINGPMFESIINNDQYARIMPARDYWYRPIFN